MWLFWTKQMGIVDLDVSQIEGKQVRTADGQTGCFRRTLFGFLRCRSALVSIQGVRGGTGYVIEGAVLPRRQFDLPLNRASCSDYIRLVIDGLKQECDMSTIEQRGTYCITHRSNLMLRKFRQPN